MFKWLRNFKRYFCNFFCTAEIDDSAYIPLIHVDYEYEYIPIPTSPLSLEGGSDDNLACYD
jgi:hypothetical protein